MIGLVGAGYRYPSGPVGLEGVDLRVSAGEVVLLTGPTGCGKSTLLRLAAGLLQRHGQGTVSGLVELDGRDPAALTPSERVGLLGFVSQEPGDQLVAGTVGDELGFAMESAGFPPEEMERRLPELLEAVGLEVGLERSTAALSGGQTQRLVVGATLAAGARALVLDEPIAQLDPEGALELLRRLRSLADEGLAVLLVEHRVGTVLPFVDRVVTMEGGRVVARATAEDYEAPPRSSTRLPPLEPGALLFSGVDLRHGYGPIEALRGVDFELRAGERVALVGPNGAGKSTLLSLLPGLLVPQDPDLALFCSTVRRELAYGPSEHGRALGIVDEVAAKLGLGELLDRPPQALSRGQRLRCAVAAALTCQPEVLLLDEPTSGQDHLQVERMMAALEGQTLVFATHDLDLAERHATRRVRLVDGRVA